MKKRLFNNIGSVFILMCVAVMGTIVTVWNFMQIYATSGLVLWAAVLAAASGAFICIGVRLAGWWVIIPAGIIAVTTFRFNMVVGGLAYIFNYFIDEVNSYYNSELYYIYFTDKMLEQGSQPLFILTACVLAGWLYTSVLLNRRGIILAVVISIISYMLPATLENAPNVYILIGVMCFVLCCLVNGHLPREKDELRGRMSGILAMAWITSLALCFLFAVTRFVPEEKYSVPGLYEDIAGRIVFSIKDVQTMVEGHAGNIDIGDEGVGGIARGSIGRVDTVEYTDNPILDVRAPKEGGTLYLKGFQAGRYTKRSWKELEPFVYEENEELFRELYASGNIPQLMGYHAVSELIDRKIDGITDVSYNIEVMQYINDGNSYVPVSAIKPAKEGMSAEAWSEAFSEYDKNIVLPGDIEGEHGTWHSLRVSEWQNFSPLDKLAAAGDYFLDDDADPYKLFVYENYLEDNTPCADRIRNELFSKIKGKDYELSAALDKVRFIMDTLVFFKDEYEYTLSPGATPSDRDYVEDFLFDRKKGLCTHFASAAVMIFRCAGIPARYVEGYVVPESLYGDEPLFSEKAAVRASDKYIDKDWEYYDAVVTDRYAHAWTEVYLDGIGWITIDPTPGYSAQYIDSQEWYLKLLEDAKEETSSDNSTGESTTEEETQEETSDNTEEETQKESTRDDRSGIIFEDGDNNSDNGAGDGQQSGDGSENADNASLMTKFLNLLKRLLTVMVSIIKTAFIPAIIVLFLVIRQKYMEQKRGKLYNKDCGLSADERIKRIMLYYERLLSHSGADVSDSMSFSEMIDNLSVSKETAATAVSTVEKVLYSQAEVKEDEVMCVLAYVAGERERIFASLGIVQRMVLKYIWVV